MGSTAIHRHEIFSDYEIPKAIESPLLASIGGKLAVVRGAAMENDDQGFTEVVVSPKTMNRLTKNALISFPELALMMLLELLKLCFVGLGLYASLSVVIRGGVSLVPLWYGDVPALSHTHISFWQLAVFVIGASLVSLVLISPALSVLKDVTLVASVMLGLRVPGSTTILTSATDYAAAIGDKGLYLSRDATSANFVAWDDVSYVGLMADDIFRCIVVRDHDGRQLGSMLAPCAEGLSTVQIYDLMHEKRNAAFKASDQCR